MCLRHTPKQKSWIFGLIWLFIGQEGLLVRKIVISRDRTRDQSIGRQLIGEVYRDIGILRQSVPLTLQSFFHFFISQVYQLINLINPTHNYRHYAYCFALPTFATQILYQIYYSYSFMQTDQFARTSPSKVFERAAAYTKNLWRHHQLPKSLSKSMVVKQQAENHKQHIDFAIRRSSYQLDLYRKKQEQDSMRRTNYWDKLASSTEKVAKNEKEIEAKKAKIAQNYDKHLKVTYRKYEDDQKRSRQLEKESSYKLRKELQEFYQKEAERKREAANKQVAVGTCYQNALEKINNIHKQNEQRSLIAELELSKDLNKNSHFDEMLNKKRRSVSSINQQKSKIYDNNMSILEKRQHTHIQKYGRNEDLSLSAFKHIEEQGQKTKKRLAEFFKRRIEKWSQDKKRVDQAKSEIPKKCTSILERTNNSFFRRSISSFRETARGWQKSVQQNKSAIRSEDERKKDEIMGTHYDLRLKNNTSFKVNERMGSMRHHAKKLASEYL